MKKFIKYLNSILITILFITSITFAAEHHTSWNEDRNTSLYLKILFL